MTKAIAQYTNFFLRQILFSRVEFGVVLMLINAAAWALDTAVVEYRDVDITYSAEAIVEAQQQSTISSQVTGRVLEVKVDAGDRIKQGQVVARIDPREATQAVASSEAQIAQARAALENARLNLERTRQLQANNFVSAAALDKAQAEYKAASAQLQMAQAGAGQAVVAKEHTLVLAPFGGVVSIRHVELGEMATPGKPLFTVFEPTDMRVITEVPQTYLPVINARGRAFVEIPSLGKWSKVKAMVILPAADPRTHSTRIRLHLEDEQRLYPGVYARAHFAIGQAKKLVVPAKAVLRRSEVSGVYVVKEKDVVTFRQVRVGEAAGEGLVEVLAGVAPGERVALEPIKAGMANPVGKPGGS